MLSQRNTPYWLWFLLFGVVSALVTIAKGEGITTETMWLLIAGFLGLLLGAFIPSLARPYDLVIGLLLTTIGLLGILHNFGLNLVGQPSAIAPNAIDEDRRGSTRIDEDRRGSTRIDEDQRGSTSSDKER